MPSRPVRAALCAALAVALAPAAAVAHPGHLEHAGAPGAESLFTVPFPPMGPSAGGYSSDNVEFVKNFPQHTDSAGARKVGDFFYITTERDLTIYDVSEPLEPVEVGQLTFPEIPEPGLPIYTEEDPDTNGEILLVSNDITQTDTGNLYVIDVRDKANPAVLATVPGVDEHTYTCVLDCTWAYGSEGTIVNLEDPENPVVSANSWKADDIESEHDVTEVSPGIVLTSTQPLKLLDAREDPENPVELASTAKEEGRFVHANRWPRNGQDDFLLVGGEDVGPGCSGTISATFSTWDARSFRETGTTRQIDEFRVLPGEPSEGRAPDSTFCVHWFDEHPYYANGGLVAIGWYEHGTHFLRIGRDGQISEVGWFLGGAGQASAAYWIDERTVYVADYLRGLDVLRFTGDIGSPPAAQPDAAPAPAPPADAAPTPPAEPAPPQTTAPDPACAVPNGFRATRAKGRGGRLAVAFRRRSSAPVNIDVFRHSVNRRIVGEELVARFRGRNANFVWDGKANRRGRTVTDGYYLVRYRTRTARGVDTRRVALRRVNGRWSTLPSFHRPASCDLLRSFKVHRPVFGGRSNRSLGIAYKVAREARVTVTVSHEGKVVRRFGAQTAAARRTHRLKLGARGLERGAYRVRIVARRAGERVAARAVSHRL